jgi:hypothetical protein
MRSKKDEAALIWEMYNSPMDDELEDDFGMEDDGMDLDIDMADEQMDAQPEVVMEFEPMGEVEPIGDEHMNEIMKSELKKLAEYGQRLNDLCGQVEFDAWMVAKIVKASDYVSDVWHRLDAGADFANTGFDQAPDYQNL